jgi:hypothetical protein
MSMKLIRRNWVRLSVWASLIAAVVAGWTWVHFAERREAERLHPILKEIRLAEEKNGNDRYAPPPAAVPHSANFARAADMTEIQKSDLARLFKDKFRPAAEHWFAAYTNRIPVGLSEITLDKFHSKYGARMYTFMLGDTTLTFVEPRNPKEPAKVGYFMVRQAAEDMNRLPQQGFVPELNLPISSAEVIDMVKADSGVEFKPSEVIIRPTGKASALNGGAFVDLLPTGNDPNNFLNYKISMTFDSNGKLVDYERDPNF